MQRTLAFLIFLAPVYVHKNKQAWLTLVFQADEQSPWKAPEHECIFCAVLADCRHVHNRQQLLDIVHQKLVEQAFIALLQCSQVAVPV